MTTAAMYKITVKTEKEVQHSNSQISLYQQLKIIWERKRRQAQLVSSTEIEFVKKNNNDIQCQHHEIFFRSQICLLSCTFIFYVIDTPKKKSLYLCWIIHIYVTLESKTSINLIQVYKMFRYLELILSLRTQPISEKIIGKKQ